MLFNKKNKKNKKTNIWNLTDDVIQIKDVIEKQYPEFSSNFDLHDAYTCLRDKKNTNIYISPSDLEKLQSISLIYDPEFDYVNVDMLLKYSIKDNCYSVIANKAVPAGVNIKFVYKCSIQSIIVYVEKVFVLKQSDKLFKDLINFQNLLDKHELKIFDKSCFKK